jgi:hypothetical protein
MAHAVDAETFLQLLANNEGKEIDNRLLTAEGLPALGKHGSSADSDASNKNWIKEQLIETVRKFRHLYDAKDKNHHNAIVCANSWCSIGKTMKMTGMYCQI